MKVIIPILLCVAAARAYEDIDDNYHKTVLGNKELLEKLYGCLVDINPCNDFGVHVKNHIQEMVSDGCKECDLIQKHFTHTYITKLINDFPELYQKFEDKYDPDRKLLKKMDDDTIKFS